MVDFVNRWSGKVEIPVCQMIIWVGVYPCRSSMDGGLVMVKEMSTMPEYRWIRGLNSGKRRRSLSIMKNILLKDIVD